MKRYMVLVEILNSGCTASFFQELDTAMDFVDTLHHDDYYVEIYVREATWLDGHVIGFEYRRIH